MYTDHQLQTPQTSGQADTTPQQAIYSQGFSQVQNGSPYNHIASVHGNPMVFTQALSPGYQAIHQQQQQTPPRGFQKLMEIEMHGLTMPGCQTSPNSWNCCQSGPMAPLH